MKYRAIYATAVCFISLSQFVAIPLKTVFFYRKSKLKFCTVTSAKSKPHTKYQKIKFCLRVPNTVPNNQYNVKY